MSGTFSGQNVLVTGGTGGIGRAIAEAFAAEGAEVVVTGLTEAEVESCRDGTRGLTAHVIDVADQAAIDRLVAGLERLDVLVNAAGMILRGAQEFEPEGFLRVVDVNLTGTMRMCRACRALLAAQGGSIVNLGSMLSFFGSGFAPAYSASKGGVAQLTKSLAIAWAAEGCWSTTRRDRPRSSRGRRWAAGGSPRTWPVRHCSSARPRRHSSPESSCRSTADTPSPEPRGD
jgi:NAD(P)-dependent dehydrogenase (short-subunit alcohol dehydrogenase family)